MTDSIDTSEREACEPRMLRLPVREMSAEPAPPPVAAGYEAHPVGTVERLRRLERENAAMRRTLAELDHTSAQLWAFAGGLRHSGHPTVATLIQTQRRHIAAALTSATKETT